MNLAGFQLAFLAELGEIKAAASIGKMQVAQNRTGRRPISAATLLDRDREGTLLRNHIKPAAAEEKQASTIGNPVVAYLDADTDLPAVAHKPRAKGDLPSREDVQTHSVRDRREDVSTIPGSGTQLVDISTSATPGGERTS